MKKPTTGTRHLAAASAALILTGGIALLGAPAAGAADNYLQFSPDGNYYGPTLEGPLFNEAVTNIPGTGQATTVWVRNNSAEPARLSTAAVMVRSDPELTGYLGLAAGSGSNVSDRVALGSSGTCMDVPATWNLDGGEEVALTFAVDMSLDAPNATRNREAEFDLLFYLESTAAGLGPRAACDALDGGNGSGTDQGADTGGVGGDARTGVRDAGAVAQGASPDRATGSLVALRGSGTSTVGPQAVAAGVVTEIPATRVPKSAEPPSQEAAPQALDAMVQSTVEPVIRSVSGTLLIAMSVAFSAAVVFRVWSRRYE